MELNKKELSKLFYNYLCHVIGSEEVVRTRRGLLSAFNDKNIDTIIISGSKAEGLNFKDSDLDIMYISHDGPVFENYEDIGNRNRYKGIPLVMDSLGIKQGFTKLKVYDESIHDPFMHKNIDGDYYISSKLFRERRLTEELIIHGPCVSSRNGKFEIAESLHCPKWVSQAQPWVARSRHSWATDEVLQKIVNFGVLFVAIGCKKSPAEDFEWRLSFSHAEKLLIWSFNHVQFLCYALMKILLKDLIKKRNGDILCSYFLKTIMFWMCEETKMVEWRADKILPCFISCFKRLIYCVKNETCLHYFIPENNFFEDRFSDEDQDALILTLNELFRIGWMCLLNTETLCTFRGLFQPSLSSEILSVSYLESLWDKNLLYAFYLSTLDKILYPVLQRNCKDICIYTLSCACLCFAELNFNKVSDERSNKVKYNLYRKGVFFALLGTKHDAVSGWLLLVSFFYTNKQYLACEPLLSHCLSVCSDKKYFVDKDVSASEGHQFNMIQRTFRLSMLTMCKLFTVTPIRFRKHSSILPDEVKRQVESPREIHLRPNEFANYLHNAIRRRNLGMAEMEIKGLDGGGVVAHIGNKDT